MKITKFVHSCLLIEIPDRTALFDPGVFSTIDVDTLKYLDDIFITHGHPDHMHADLIKQLRQKFPEVRITAPADAKAQLEATGVTNISTDAPEGVRFFDAPHEEVRPYSPSAPPQEIGIHYLDVLSAPGDSHRFSETMPILALPITAPWGSVVNATRLGLELKPKYIIPVHDYHWRDDVRQQTYDTLEQRFASQGITFIKPVDGKSFTINI